jgi:hypothetical protein
MSLRLRLRAKALVHVVLQHERRGYLGHAFAHYKGYCQKCKRVYA